MTSQAILTRRYEPSPYRPLRRLAGELRGQVLRSVRVSPCGLPTLLFEQRISFGGGKGRFVIITLQKAVNCRKGNVATNLTSVVLWVGEEALVDSRF